ncbi:CBS domain-containing protein [Persephonella sp.]|uniref:CBS domain-containing protein n=1 Tax=Persephonella sp. TaxID=2060922 RepID=UPI0025D15813|nr:CBS domain-containing protein [Persephonella sp.]
MVVKDIMSKDVYLVQPTATLKEALKIMKENDVKALIVDKQHSHDAYGIITYTSILKAIYMEEGDIDLLNVYDVAVKPAITISGEIDIKYAAKMMVNFNIKRLPVVENNEIKGIISMTDIIESLFKEIGE